MNSGIDPASITYCVCSAVPDAILVSAHAASNYGKDIMLNYDRDGNVSHTCNIEWPLFKNKTKRGITPHSMTFSIGGFFSLESSLRNRVVASSWRSATDRPCATTEQRGLPLDRRCRLVLPASCTALDSDPSGP